jgi:hypothetical protein
MFGNVRAQRPVPDYLHGQAAVLLFIIHFRAARLTGQIFNFRPGDARLLQGV